MVLCLTARNNDGERGIDRTDFPDKVFAFTVGQTHVNDHGIDAARNKLQFVQRFRRRNRDVHLQARFLQIFSCDQLNEGLILDHEDAGGSRSGIQNIAQFLAERRLREGLCQKLHPRIEPALMHDGVARVRGREQHLEIWPPGPRFLGELAAIHAAGKSHIGEKQGNLGVGFQHFKGFPAVCRFQHAIAKLAQGLA